MSKKNEIKKNVEKKQTEEEEALMSAALNRDFTQWHQAELTFVALHNGAEQVAGKVRGLRKFVAKLLAAIFAAAFQVSSDMQKKVEQVYSEKLNPKKEVINENSSDQ